MQLSMELRSLFLLLDCLPLKRRILEDEAIFLENNKERLKKIREDREIEIDIGESSEEENSSSDFVDI